MSLFGIFGRTGPVEAVMIQTRTGGTIKGVLIETRRGALILRAASVATLGINEQQSWQKMIGDIVIPAENIDYYQTALPLSVLD